MTKTIDRQTTTGNAARAVAVRDYRSIMRSIMTCARLYAHPRTGIDTRFRLADEITELQSQCEQLHGDWNIGTAHRHIL